MTIATAPAETARPLDRFLSLFFRFETGSGWRLESLDGLRGIAATLVVLAHVYDEPLEGAPTPPRIPLLHPFLRTGGSGGVMLFFVLSGFLLYLPWARAHVDGTPPPTWKMYALRRCLRIMPAYYAIVLLLAFVPMLFGAPAPGAMRLVLHFAFLPSLSSRFPAFLGVFWTLQVEEFFYWSLPFLHQFFRRGLALGLSVMVGTAIVYAALVLHFLPDRYWVGLINQTPFHFLAFACGMVGATLYARDRANGRKRSLAGLLAVAVGLYLGAGWICTYVVETRPELQSLSSIAFLPACACAVFAGAHGAGQPVLASAPLRFLGAISYSLYLWHLVFIRLVPMPSLVLPHLATRTAYALVVAIVVAAANFLAVERPFLKLRPHRR